VTNGYEERLQRIKSAISLEKPDRVPVVPLLDCFPPRYAGMTQGESYRDKDKTFQAYLKTQKDFDLDALMKPNRSWVHLADRLSCPPYSEKLPGVDIAEDDMIQVDEVELISRDDYKRIADLGWNGFWKVRYPELYGETLEEARGDSCADSMIRFNRESKICKEKGFPVLLGAQIDSPTMAFSMARTLTSFTMDLFEVPDLVDAAIEASVDDLIENALLAYEQTDGMMMWITLERCSGALYRLDIFERFLWPHLQKYVNTFVDKGMTPWFHMDTDWTLNLPYFKDLPKGKCIMDLDGTTDIFNAKKILGGHMCLSGDISATLYSLGDPETVTDYCNQLIEGVGGDGGFILTSGCEMPMDAKIENVQAMVNASKAHQVAPQA
jgi:uroporphyrinogen-III decarboxylase